MKKWLTVLILLIIVFSIGYGVQLLLAQDDTPPMSENEAVEAVQSKFNANVTNIVLHDRTYEVNFETNNGNYLVKMDRATGKVSELTLVEKHEDTYQGNQAQSEQQSAPSSRIGEKKAADIALSEIDGVVDDVDLEWMDGTYVYIVEIETKDDDVDVYIQAYTGEILNYSFESDDDDDD